MKDVFVQVFFDPVGAPVFGYEMAENVVVDLRLKFVWRDSPRIWGLMTSAREHAHTHCKFQDAAVSPQGPAAVEHVRLAPPRGGSVRSLPRDCQTVSGTSEVVFFVRYYVVDGILVEVQWWPDGRRFLRAVQPLESDHFRLLGVRGASNSPLLSASKITSWDTCFEVLGSLVDTEALMVTSAPHNRLKLRLFSEEWPSTRSCALAKQVSQLAGFVMHISFAVRHGYFLMHRLLGLVGMPRIAAGDRFAGRMANPERSVARGPEVHADLEFWRRFIDNGVDTRDGVLSAPMYNLVQRPKQRTLFADSSKTTVGGYCLETGVYWRYDLTA